MSRYLQVPVDVLVIKKFNGEQTPISLYWIDGREFTFSSVVPKKRMRCEKTYGDAFRYECVIAGRRKLLYLHDDGYFFVEVEAPKDPEERNTFEALVEARRLAARK